MKRFFAFAAAMLAAAAAVAQQQDFSKVEIKVQKVQGTVYMLTGAGGNIGVSVGDDGIVIVDDEFAPLAPKIKEALKSISAKPIKFILNTHFHGDHTGGNEVFAKEGTIIAHDNVRTRLAAGSKVGTHETPPAAKGALPIITFNDTATIHVNGEDIRAVHFPHGHTDTDSVIFFSKSNVVHMGDDLFFAQFPFVDLENGGSVRGLIKNLEKIMPMIDDDTKLIAGHGSLSDKKALNEWINMLKGTVAIMNEAIQKGLTLEQVKAEKTLVAWSNWDQGFMTLDKYEEQLYKELTAKP
ncbi:MAG TPA: MBL fold metallo-hydrolase [Thermoanaerobaculia bacterium]|jgi:glyoxylase-like metal-dependent hydrolase (beta-lactamase superfamily II)